MSCNRLRRIGLMPGSFDPCHRGHIELAVAAYEAADLDWVFIYLNSFNEAKRAWLESSAHRRAMLELAIDHARMSVLPAEYFAEDPGCGNDFDFGPLIDKLHRDNPEAEIWMVRGSDYFIGAAADRYPQGLWGAAHAIGYRAPHHEASSSRLPNNAIMFDAYGTSSTAIRAMEGGAPCEALDPRVELFCRMNRLYGFHELPA